MVVLVFDESATAVRKPSSGTARGTPRERALVRNDRFRHSDATMWNDEDLDTPTYIRRHLTLDR